MFWSLCPAVMHGDMPHANPSGNPLPGFKARAKEATDAMFGKPLSSVDLSVGPAAKTCNAAKAHEVFAAALRRSVAAHVVETLVRMERSATVHQQEVNLGRSIRIQKIPSSH